MKPLLDRLSAAKGDKGGSAIYDDQDAIDDAMAEIIKIRTALRAIIERADTDKPGTSKVQDMRRIAMEAVGE